MGPLCARAVLMFVIGYIGTILAELTKDADSIKLKSYPVDCSECGFQPPPSFMIRYGKAIKATKNFPWMVSLRATPDFNACGGAILDEYFILTAGHCALDKKRNINYDLKVHFQTETVGKLSKGAAIEKFIIHPKFQVLPSNATNIVFAKYDIALLKLKKKIKCNTYKRPICLPSPDVKIATGKKSIIAAWGTPLPGLKGQTPVLNYGSLKHLDFKECIKAVPETKKIREHMLCLGETKHTICYGDSGSPLMNISKSKCIVVGIASSETNKSCPPTSPVIYTEVAKFVDWIQKERKAFLEPDSSQGKTVLKKIQRYPKTKCRQRNYYVNEIRSYSCKNTC